MLLRFTQLFYFYNVLSHSLLFKQTTNDNMDNFLVTFKDPKALKSWIGLLNEKKDEDISWLKNVVGKISDIISEINTKSYSVFKTIISKTEIVSFHDIGEEFLETFIIITSIKRIMIKIKNKEKETKSYKKGFKSANYDIKDYGAFAEFSSIYKDIDSVFYNVHNRALISKSGNHNFDYVACSEVWRKAILPKDKSTIVCVFASSKGLSLSRKSLNASEALYLENECTMLSLEWLLEESGKSVSYDGDIFDISMYMDSKFKLNTSSTALLISLIHFHSFLNQKNTVYELKRLEKNLYLVFWRAEKAPTKENMRDFYRKKNLPASSTVKLLDERWPLKDSNRVYTTKKPAEYMGSPVTERLIVFSCGHQLGFSNIDEYFEHLYEGYNKESKCHSCDQNIEILGSYDAKIYEE